MRMHAVFTCHTIKLTDFNFGPLQFDVITHFQVGADLYTNGLVSSEFSVGSGSRDKNMKSFCSRISVIRQWSFYLLFITAAIVKM